MNLTRPVFGLALAVLSAQARAQDFPPAMRISTAVLQNRFVFSSRPPTANEVAVAEHNSLMVVAPVAISHASPPAGPPAGTAMDGKPKISEFRLEVFGAKSTAPATQPRPEPPLTSRPVLSSLTLPVPAPKAAARPVTVTQVPPQFVPPPVTSGRSANNQPVFGVVPPPNRDLNLTGIIHPATPVPAEPDQLKPLLKDSSSPAVDSPEAEPEKMASAKVPEAKPAKPTKSKPSKNLSSSPKLVVNLDNELGGQVVTADENGRFVILNFPLGQMPRIDSRMTLYRHGIKAATVKITGPQRDDTIAADVLEGSPLEGDSAREE